MKEMGIYIHIPFCVKKCSYCDFLSFPGTEEAQRSYVTALLTEIRMRAGEYKEYSVPTIFIGGGTPSAIDPVLIQKVLTCLKENFKVEEGAEVSIEINPGTVTNSINANGTNTNGINTNGINAREKLEIYREAGVNRLSIGLQSARDEELKKLGRLHNFEEFLETYSLAVKIGYENINVDVMSALPGQSLSDYKYTLEQILTLRPRPVHISAYSLIIEEGTPFYDWDRAGKLSLPDESQEREMAEYTESLLRREGYGRYEISNYAMPGYECRHNKGYWTRKNYLGLGLGAASLVENVRMKNETDIKTYCSGIQTGKEVWETSVLSREEQMEEFMFLGLRLTEGVGVRDFRESFGIWPEEVYLQVLEKHVENGLLHWGERIRFTSKGMDVSNYVMSDFLF